MRLPERIIITLLVASFGLSGCSTLNTKIGGFFNADTDLTLNFKVENSINPDEKKTPSPLFVRLYELKSSKQFESANFIDLFERDKEALGESMIAKQRLKRLKPGEDREDQYVLSKETRFVGIFAEFLEYQSAKYKVIFPVDATNVFASEATVSISGNTIVIK